MLMKAKGLIDRGKEKILPGENFTPKSKEEADRLLRLDAAEVIVEGEGKDSGSGSAQEPPKKLSAAEAIEEIGKCATVDEVKAFFKGEERSTVIDAARAKIKAIKDAEKSAAS